MMSRCVKVKTVELLPGDVIFRAWEFASGKMLKGMLGAIIITAPRRYHGTWLDAHVLFSNKSQFTFENTWINEYDKFEVIRSVT